jgi:hypothetical protein
LFGLPHDQVKYDLKKESQQSRFVFAILYIKNIGFPLGTKQEDLLYDKYYRYYSYRDLLHVVGQTRHIADEFCFLALSDACYCRVLFSSLV